MSAPFRLYALRFEFAALERIHVPPDRAGNLLRGSLGAALKKLFCAPACDGAASCPGGAAYSSPGSCLTPASSPSPMVRPPSCAYASLFEPQAAGSGPSGLRNWPRPFVFRTAPIDGATLAPGAVFHIDLNLFDMRPEAREALALAFAELGRAGLGIGPVAERGRAELRKVQGAGAPLTLPLDPAPQPVHRVLVRFLTPMELKGGDPEGEDSDRGNAGGSPRFAILAARFRDRLSTLSALYGDGPLRIDFRGFGERAAQVRTVRSDGRHVNVSRRSRRTGQIHSLGGWVGEAEYAGDLAEFLPYLLAGRFTGAGRQTSWGKGEIETTVLS